MQPKQSALRKAGCLLQKQQTRRQVLLYPPLPMTALYAPSVAGSSLPVDVDALTVELNLQKRK